MMMRLGEMFLIRSEAWAQLDSLDQSLSDLNIIRVRAGLPIFLTSSKTDLLKKIIHERQVELFCEMGHRWFDLKRTGIIDSVMNNSTSVKGGKWAPHKCYFPISNNEILRSQNILQTLGY